MKPSTKNLAARVARAAVSLSLAVAMTGAPAALAQPKPAAVGNGAANPAVAVSKQQVADAYAALDAAIKALPADSFDPQAVAERVGQDPQKLFEWVRDQTYYAPYAGALRGPTGVLADRVGSSLDRALLLAELMRSSGFEVRLARGTPADPAKVAAAARPIPANWLDAARAADDAAAPAASPELKADQEAIAAASKAALAKATAHADAVLKATAPAAKPAAAVAAAPADHWWVQVKRDGKWVDADPTAQDAKLGDKLADAAETLPAPADDGKLAGLPAAQVHAVDLKVVVERLENGKLAEASPLTLTVKPAELQGKRIVFTHLPVAWKLPGTAPAAQRAKALAETTEFVPVLYVGGAASANDAVTDAGQLNERPDLDRTAGMGKAAGNTFGGLGGGLSGGDGGQAAKGVWTAEWVEVTVRAPGRPAKTIRREVFDLIGPAARAAAPVVGPKVDEAVRLDRALALTGETDVLVLGSQATPEYVAHAYASALMKVKRQALAAADGPKDPKAAAAKSAGNNRISQTIGTDVRKLTPSPLWGVATGRAAASPAAGDVYLDSPNVFCLTRRARAGAGGSLVTLVRTDLAVNDVAVRGGADAFAARVRQGVADTVVEADVIRTVAEVTVPGEPTTAAA
ncbi:MAG TPA: transglutaminase domain-containing protein, partial [Humisphaera sp.]